VQENFAGVRVVAGLRPGKREMADFERTNEAYLEGNRRLIGWTVAFHPILQG